MISPEIYRALSKLINDSEWKYVEEFVENEVGRITDTFITTPGADLKELQIRAMELNRLIRYIKQSVREYEEKGN